MTIRFIPNNYGSTGRHAAVHANRRAGVCHRAPRRISARRAPPSRTRSGTSRRGSAVSCRLQRTTRRVSLDARGRSLLPALSFHHRRDRGCRERVRRRHNRAASCASTCTARCCAACWCRSCRASSKPIPICNCIIGEGDRLVDLVREGVDCVVRAGATRDSTMVTRQIAVMDEVTIASPAYLRARWHAAQSRRSRRSSHDRLVSSAMGHAPPLEFMCAKASVS